jgi:hypothetical protein
MARFVHHVDHTRIYTAAVIGLSADAHHAVAAVKERRGGLRKICSLVFTALFHDLRVL